MNEKKLIKSINRLAEITMKNRPAALEMCRKLNRIDAEKIKFKNDKERREYFKI